MSFRVKELRAGGAGLVVAIEADTPSEADSPDAATAAMKAARQAGFLGERVVSLTSDRGVIGFDKDGQCLGGTDDDPQPVTARQLANFVPVSWRREYEFRQASVAG